MMKLTEAIRHAEQVADSYKDTAPDCNCAVEHRQLAEWLKELQRYQWVPCSERLPSENGSYLTTYEWVGLIGTSYTEIDFTDYERGRWQRDFETVIAWMELPAPYQPKGEQDE